MPQKSRKPAPVHIQNPAGEHRYTSAKNAQRMVDRGIAEWINPQRSIRLNESHYAVRAGLATAALTVTRRGEGEGMAPLDAVQGLPCAGPAIRLFYGKRSTLPVYDHSTVETERRLLPVESWL